MSSTSVSAPVSKYKVTLAFARLREGLTLSELVDREELQISDIFLHHHDPGFRYDLHDPDPLFPEVELGVLVIELE